MKAFLLSVQALFYFVLASAQIEKTITVPYTSSASPTFQALLYLPSDYSTSSKSYPLLVFCHGSGEAADGGSGGLGLIYNSSGSGGPAYFIEHGGWPATFTNPVTGAQEQFIVVSPQANTWDMSGDALANVVNYLVKTYRVDVNRINLTGLSAGGESVVEYVSQLDPSEDPPAGGSSDKRTYPAACVVPMSQATNEPTQAWGNIAVANGTPCWGFGDPVNDIHGEMTQDYTGFINTAKSGYARFTTFNTGHGPWSPFYNPSYTENFTWNGVTAKYSIYTWMLANSRAAQTPAALVANAGSAQTITLPTNQVTLSSSASTGTITSYAWTKLSGPSSGTISSPSAATTTVTGLVQGVYVFQLKINGSSVSTVQITVNSVVTTLVANAGSAQTITLPTSQVTLSGSASTGTITSYTWTKLSGPSSGTISSPSAVTTTVTGLVQGVYVFQLKINSVGLATVQVTVNAAGGKPVGPVANAGSAQTITLPTSQLILNASASTGTITSYVWTMVSGPNTPTISAPTSVSTWVTGLIAGTYVFQLKLNGGSVATVQVTVNAAGGKPVGPVANAGSAQTITLPTSQLILNASASTGTITSYAWTKVSGPNTPTISAASAVSTWVTGLVAGTYVFQLSVNGGASKAQVTVTVNPIVVVTTTVANAGIAQTITLPTSQVTLNGSGSTGIITSYAWTKVSGPNTATISSASGASTVVSGLIAGTYVFQLSVNGGVSTAQTTVTVNPIVVVTTGKCGGSKKYLSPDPGDSSVYMTTSTNPSTLQFHPGDTIAFKAGTGYGQIELHYITGTAQCPIVITNEGGQAWIKGFFKIYGAKYVHIDGSAAGQQYGLKIQYDPHNITGDFRNGVGLQISERSKCVEINNVFINHTIFGMAIKQSPDCADSLNYPNWIMDSIYIHDNLIRQVGLEGMYIGDTDPDNGPKSGDPRYVIGCHAVLDTIYPRPIRSGHMRIYNNIIDSTERGGIQLSGHSDSVALIYGNTVMHNGMDGDVQQGTGISLGMYTQAYVHDNIVKNNTTWGIASLGGAGTGVPLRIEHNTLDSIGYGKHYNNVTDVIFPITPTTPMYTNTSGTPSGADFSFANPIFIKTVTNMDGDSTVFWIKNNILGTSLAEKMKTFPSDSAAVQVFDYASTPMMQKVGSQVCGNVRINGVTPASIYIDAGIKYSTTCTITPPTAVVANAGTAQTITLPTNSVTLNGSASTGTITSWSWTKSSGPSSGTITTPAAVATAVTGLVQGVYIFQLTLNGSTSSTVQVTVNPAGVVVPPTPPVQTPSPGSKFIDVNIYGGDNPYANTQWNNWNVNDLVTSSTLNYTDGTSSGITATLSLNESVVDNGTTYGGTMAPPEVLEYTSYGESSRTLTLSGLNPTATYAIELYASRNSNSGNTTVFSVGNATASVVTYDNLANKAVLSNLKADGSGNIVITISTPNSYNYLNGFIITETGGTVSADVKDQTVSAAAISGLDSVVTGNLPSISVYPNPVRDNFILELNNGYRGSMKVTIVDQTGAIRHSSLFTKDQQTSTITLSASDLASGVYFITVQMGGQKETKKILKL